MTLDSTPCGDLSQQVQWCHGIHHKVYISVFLRDKNLFLINRTTIQSFKAHGYRRQCMSWIIPTHPGLKLVIWGVYLAH